MIDAKEIEKLEKKYLGKINSTLDHHLDKIIDELNSMNKIFKYWNNIPFDKGMDSGAERVIYSKLHSGSLGDPNSSPVASDLFFENKEAFIHIDLKTNQPYNNLSDHWRIPIGVNQNSYKCKFSVRKKAPRLYKPNLPTYYNEKLCLTYFISILYTRDNKFDVLNINTSCVPNGELLNIYGGDILAAGKNPEKKKKTGSVEKDKARYLTRKNLYFELLCSDKIKYKRTIISHKNMDLINRLPDYHVDRITKGKKKGQSKKTKCKLALLEYLDDLNT